MESTRATTRECGSRAEANCEILLFPTADRCLMAGKSNAPPGGPHFGSNSHFTELNARGLPGRGRGGDGQFWN